MSIIYNFSLTIISYIWNLFLINIQEIFHHFYLLSYIFIFTLLKLIYTLREFFSTLIPSCSDFISNFIKKSIFLLRCLVHRFTCSFFDFLSLLIYFLMSFLSYHRHLLFLLLNLFLNITCYFFPINWFFQLLKLILKKWKRFIFLYCLMSSFRLLFLLSIFFFIVYRFLFTIIFLTFFFIFLWHEICFFMVNLLMIFKWLKIWAKRWNFSFERIKFLVTFKKGSRFLNKLCIFKDRGSKLCSYSSSLLKDFMIHAWINLQ